MYIANYFILKKLMGREERHLYLDHLKYNSVSLVHTHSSKVFWLVTVCMRLTWRLSWHLNKYFFKQLCYWIQQLTWQNNYTQGVWGATLLHTEKKQLRFLWKKDERWKRMKDEGWRRREVVSCTGGTTRKEGRKWYFEEWLGEGWRVSASRSCDWDSVALCVCDVELSTNVPMNTALAVGSSGLKCFHTFPTRATITTG